MSGLLCSGNVRIAYVDADGVPTGGFIGVVNPVKLSINVPDPDAKTRQSKMNDSYGQALDQIFQPKPTEIEFSTDDVGDQEVLGWAVNGTPASFSQASATVTPTAYTAHKGQWVRLPHRGISAVTVTDNAGTTTYVAGTDYLVDAAAGMIKVTEAGAIADASLPKINYTAAALTGKKVSVGTRSSLQVCIEGDMRNLATGRMIHVVVPKAKLSPSGGLDLLGSDFLVAALKGTALSIAGGPVADITLLDT